MGIVKSHAQEKLLTLVNETIVDAYVCLSQLAVPVPHERELVRDIDYVSRRCAEEGITFLTETLPRLGEFFDKVIWGIPVERVEGFKPYDGLFPCFLKPFWRYFQNQRLEEFSATDARLVRILRTLLHGLKKLNVPSTQAKIDAKIQSFLMIEDELEYFDVVPTPVLQRAQLLLEQFTEDYVPTCNWPKHGPGAVAGGERHFEKWNFSTLYNSVHQEWPYYEYLFPVRSVIQDHPGIPARSRCLQLAANAGTYMAMPREPEPTARLLLVPKDSRGPRVISCEPKELMYLQQGVYMHLVRYISRHKWTSGHVNFDDQTINSNLALLASKTKAYDTIDMADASDRVSCQLVNFLFPKRVSKKWFALRSTATKLPDGRIIPMRKFAPMGSALCFPVESLVFWSIAVAYIWECTRNLDFALANVYVFGDDIIVKEGYTLGVMNSLESVALKVNRSKSFIGNHPFRESCGIEALNGYDVTPLRIKTLPPQRPSDGSGLTAWVKYAENTQYISPNRGITALRIVEDLIGPVPRVRRTQPFLSLVTEIDVWDLSKFQTRFSARRQVLEVRALTVQIRGRTETIRPWARLQRNLRESFADRDPLLVVDRQSTLIKKRYTQYHF